MQLTKPSTKTLVRTETGYEISVYNGKLTKEAIKNGLELLSTCFPDQDPRIYTLLTKLAIEEKMSTKQWNDAITHLIKTNVYPTFRIANILSYDKKITTYDYNQVINNKEYEGHWFEYFKPVLKAQGKTLYAHISDIEEYGLTVLKSSKTEK